jgi:hypothetical protein
MIKLIASYTPNYTGLYAPHFVLPQNLHEKIKQSVFVFEKAIPLIGLCDKWLNRLTLVVPLGQLCAIPFLKGSMQEKVLLCVQFALELIARMGVGEYGEDGNKTEIGKEAPLLLHAIFDIVIWRPTLDPSQDLLTKVGRIFELLNAGTYIYGVNKKNYLPSILADLSFNGVQMCLAAKGISLFNSATSTSQKILGWTDIAFKAAICIVRLFQVQVEMRKLRTNPIVESARFRLNELSKDQTATVNISWNDRSCAMKHVRLNTIDGQEYLVGTIVATKQVHKIPTYEIQKIDIGGLEPITFV